MSLRSAAGSAAKEAEPREQAGRREQVWALDFDGVVCDSVGESSLTAWKAASVKWPAVFGTSEAEAKKETVMEGMRIVRPVIETGWVTRPFFALLPDCISRIG